MVHTEDETSLQRMLGIEGLPESLVKEYEIRLQMFHRDGNSGPLGSLGLIDLARSQGLMPVFAQEKPAPVDWRAYPNGTRVEARFNGCWISGVFGGFIENGTLAVKLDEDDFIKECRKDMVRLAALQAPPLAEESQSDKVSDEDAEDVIEGTDWSKVEVGAPVLIDEGGDTKEGTFVTFYEDLMPPLVAVTMDGREGEVIFDLDQVELVGVLA